MTITDLTVISNYFYDQSLCHFYIILPKMNLINLQQWQPPWIFLLTYQNRQNGFELF